MKLFLKYLFLFVLLLSFFNNNIFASQNDCGMFNTQILDKDDKDYDDYINSFIDIVKIRIKDDSILQLED
jgi:hypothetical protein